MSACVYRSFRFIVINRDPLNSRYRGIDARISQRDRVGSSKEKKIVTEICGPDSYQMRTSVAEGRPSTERPSQYKNRNKQARERMNKSL